MKTYQEILNEVLLNHGLVGISNSLKEVFYDAMCQYADQFIVEKDDVIKSVCDNCTAYPFDERGKTPLCKTCKDNPSQTVF